MDSGTEISVEVAACPEASEQIEARIHEAVDEIVRFVRQDTGAMRLMKFERTLWPRVALLFRLCVALFLAVRRQHLDLSSYEAAGWCLKREFAPRTIKTLCGAVTYGRAYLRRHGEGWFPLDALLGITSDGFSWLVIDVVTRWRRGSATLPHAASDAQLGGFSMHRQHGAGQRGDRRLQQPAPGPAVAVRSGGHQPGSSANTDR